MRIAINAISATAGGGRTYLLNLIRVLPALETHEYLLYVPVASGNELAGLPSNFKVEESSFAERSYMARFFWEQLVLPRRIARWGADVLICLGNFCPLRSPAPVVLLSRNSLYFTPRYLEDLLQRRHYGWALQHRLMSRLALQAARRATLTITPTAAMRKMIELAARENPPASLRTIPHGFQPWPARNGSTRPSMAPPFRFLIVSHYNYFRDFETVFRALALLSRDDREAAQLILSTSLQPGLRLGGYDPTAACRLLDELGIRDRVTTLGAVEYDDLPALYGSAHAVICPAYAESFSHTLVEAMATGVPVIASGISAHREVAGDAALFFFPGNPEDLARQCRLLMQDDVLRERLRSVGLERARTFSWRLHFEKLLAAAVEAARS